MDNKMYINIRNVALLGEIPKTTLQEVVFVKHISSRKACICNPMVV